MTAVPVWRARLAEGWCPRDGHPKLVSLVNSLSTGAVWCCDCRVAYQHIPARDELRMEVSAYGPPVQVGGRSLLAEVSHLLPADLLDDPVACPVILAETVSELRRMWEARNQ